MYTGDDTASYKLSATSNDLTVGGTAKEGISGGNSIYYTFEATASTAYRVTLQPTVGDTDLEVYSGASGTSYSYTETSLPSGLIGESANSGTTTDVVTFAASTTGTHYIEVDPSLYSSEHTYTIKVEETAVAADLSVSINSVTEQLGSITIDYTVTNSGLVEAGPFDVHFMADSATAPAAGTTTGVISSHVGLAVGSTVDGTAVVATSTETGTAYAIVDPVNVVTESNDDDNVSLGAPWTAPYSAPVSFDFEGAVVPTYMGTSGDADWDISETVNPVGSSYSFKAGPITHSQQSCFDFSVGNVASISFDFKVDSEEYYDYLYLYKDGYAIWYRSGVIDWSAAEISVSDGAVHNYRWCYTKSSANSYGLDTAWVDNITFTPTPPDLLVSLTSVSSDGANVTIGYEVQNQWGDAAASVLQLWSDSATVPLVGAFGETSVNIPALAAGETYVGSVVIANANASGTAYASSTRRTRSVKAMKRTT